MQNEKIHGCAVVLFLTTKRPSVTVTGTRKCNGEALKKARKHYTLGVLYYAVVTARSCEHFPLPSIL